MSQKINKYVSIEIEKEKEVEREYAHVLVTFGLELHEHKRQETGIVGRQTVIGQCF